MQYTKEQIGLMTVFYECYYVSPLVDLLVSKDEYTEYKLVHNYDAVNDIFVFAIKVSSIYEEPFTMLVHKANLYMDIIPYYETAKKIYDNLKSNTGISSNITIYKPLSFYEDK